MFNKSIDSARNINNAPKSITFFTTETFNDYPILEQLVKYLKDKGYEVVIGQHYGGGVLIKGYSIVAQNNFIFVELGAF